MTRLHHSRDAAMPRRHDRGFSLLETVIAISLLMIVSLGLLPL